MCSRSAHSPRPQPRIRLTGYRIAQTRREHERGPRVADGAASRSSPVAPLAASSARPPPNSARHKPCFATTAGVARCAYCRSDPRQPASAPGSRSRGRAATLVNADLAPGPGQTRVRADRTQVSAAPGTMRKLTARKTCLLSAAVMPAARTADLSCAETANAGGGAASNRLPATAEAPYPRKGGKLPSRRRCRWPKQSRSRRRPTALPVHASSGYPGLDAVVTALVFAGFPTFS